MYDNLLFSLIIPSYNRAKFIQKTIETVLNENYPHVEIIVVDDGSTDNTEEIVRGINSDRIRYFKIQNSERAAARNYGTKQAKGSYISFLDSDDQLLPNHHEEALNMIRKYDGPPVFHLNYYLEDNRNIRRIAQVTKHLKKELTKGNPFSTNGVFMKREVALENLFNEDRKLSATEDYELWTRIAARYPILFSEVPTSVIHMHDDRSVLGSMEDALVMRKDLFLQYAFKDPYVQKIFGTKKHIFDAYFLTYIALHLVLGKKRIKGYQYLLKAAVLYPPVLFERRTLAIVKRTFITV